MSERRFYNRRLVQIHFLGLYPAAASTVGYMNDGQFHHFAVVRQSGQLTYFKDGHPAGSTPGTTPLNALNINIGTTPTGETFQGLIDELTFYNRALTSNEVKNIVALNSGGKWGVTETEGQR